MTTDMLPLSPCRWTLLRDGSDSSCRGEAIDRERRGPSANLRRPHNLSIIPCQDVLPIQPSVAMVTF